MCDIVAILDVAQFLGHCVIKLVILLTSFFFFPSYKRSDVAQSLVPSFEAHVQAMDLTRIIGFLRRRVHFDQSFCPMLSFI